MKGEHSIALLCEVMAVSRSRYYLKALAIVCIERSMSRTGNCFDNAVMESFWSTYKTESEVEEILPPTRPAAELATFDYIETFYNTTRSHSSLGYISPVAFENQHTKKDIKAA